MLNKAENPVCIFSTTQKDTVPDRDAHCHQHCLTNFKFKVSSVVTFTAQKLHLKSKQSKKAKFMTD